MRTLSRTPLSALSSSSTRAFSAIRSNKVVLPSLLVLWDAGPEAGPNGTVGVWISSMGRPIATGCDHAQHGFKGFDAQDL